MEAANVTGFADDLSFWIARQTFNECVSGLNIALSTLNEWALQWGFQFSAQKSAVIHFYKRDADIAMVPAVRLGDHDLPVVEEAKYLGVTLDRRLSWRPHLLHVASKCQRKLGMMAHLASRSYGISTPQAIGLYKSLIRPLMEYGAPIWSGTRDDNLQLLRRVQRNALQWCSGAMCTSLEALEVDCDVEPLDLRWTVVTQNWLSRIWRLPEQHPLREEYLAAKDFVGANCSFLSRALHSRELRELDVEDPLRRLSTLDERKAVIRKAMRIEWHRRWSLNRDGSDARGAHLFELCPQIIRCKHQWSQSRRLSSIRCRLRHGHVELNEYLHKIGRTASAACPQEHCSDRESVEHYLMVCDYYVEHRCALYSALPADSVPSMQLLLATDPVLTNSQRTHMVKALEDYIIATDRFKL
jgi:hypothetical protein